MLSASAISLVLVYLGDWNMHAPTFLQLQIFELDCEIYLYWGGGNLLGDSQFRDGMQSNEEKNQEVSNLTLHESVFQQTLSNIWNNMCIPYYMRTVTHVQRNKTSFRLKSK